MSDALSRAAARLTLEPRKRTAGNADGLADAAQAAGHFTTEQGLGDRFVEAYGAGVRYLADVGEWLVWNQAHWAYDRTGAVPQLMTQVVRGLWDLVPEHAGDERKRLAKHAERAEALRYQQHALEFVKVHPDIAVVADMLDRDPWLLACPNGTLDLRTATLRAAAPADLLTRSTRVPFDAACATVRWDRFLREVMRDSVALTAFLRRLAGYCLTGLVSEQVAVFCYGSGSNGKSTFLEVLGEVFGDYAHVAKSSALLLERRDDGGSASPALMDLMGRRLVTVSEVNEGRKLDEAAVKSLTGDAALTARPLYGAQVTFPVTFKIVSAVNHYPQIRGTDDAIWRRIVLVPFTRTFADGEKDLRLKDALRAELPGILAWAVAGCLEWQRDGLSQPSEVRAAVATYRSESDVVGQWLEERCDLSSPNAMESAGALHRDFLGWVETTSAHRMSTTAFGKRLEERGLRADKGNSGLRIRRGIALRRDHTGPEGDR